MLSLCVDMKGRSCNCMFLTFLAIKGKYGSDLSVYDLCLICRTAIDMSEVDLGTEGYLLVT